MFNKDSQALLCYTKATVGIIVYYVVCISVHCPVCIWVCMTGCVKLCVGVSYECRICVCVVCACVHMWTRLLFSAVMGAEGGVLPYLFPVPCPNSVTSPPHHHHFNHSCSGWVLLLRCTGHLQLTGLHLTEDRGGCNLTDNRSLGSHIY